MANHFSAGELFERAVESVKIEQPVAPKQENVKDYEEEEKAFERADDDLIADINVEDLEAAENVEDDDDMVFEMAQDETEDVKKSMLATTNELA